MAEAAMVGEQTAALAVVAQVAKAGKVTAPMTVEAQAAMLGKQTAEEAAAEVATATATVAAAAKEAVVVAAVVVTAAVAAAAVTQADWAVMKAVTKGVLVVRGTLGESDSNIHQSKSFGLSCSSQQWQSERGTHSCFQT